MTRAELPGPHPGTPARDVEHHHGLYLGQLDLLVVHVEDELLVQILTLSFQHIFCTVTKVDELIDNTGGDHVEGRLASLVEVVSDERVDTNTEVVVHEDGAGWQLDAKMPPGSHPDLPPVQGDHFGVLCKVDNSDAPESLMCTEDDTEVVQELADVRAGVAAGAVAQGPGQVIARAQREYRHGRGRAQLHLVDHVEEPTETFSY